jgi:hypothetical protein
MVLVRVDDPGDLKQRYAGYAAHPSVAFVQPDYYGEGGFTPDDSQWTSIWHHGNTGQFGGTPGADLESEAGWDLSRGSPSVVVAVLDSGIDSDHPEFAGRILPGWDFVNDVKPHRRHRLRERERRRRDQYELDQLPRRVRVRPRYRSPEREARGRDQRGLRRQRGNWECRRLLPRRLQPLNLDRARPNGSTRARSDAKGAMEKAPASARRGPS